MKKVRSDFLIAAAVILCSLVLLGALSLAISGTDLNRPKALLTIDLPNAVGLDRQAQVRYAGTIAGRIRSLRPLTDPLPPGTILYAKHSANLDEVLASGKELLDDVNQLLTKNDSAISQAILDLKNVLENFKVVATYAKTFMGTVARKPWRLLWGGPVPRLPSEESILKTDKVVPGPIPND